MLRHYATAALAIIALACFPPLAASQSRMIVPGDGTATGSSIEPYAAEWLMTLHSANGDKPPLGRWLDTLGVITIDGIEYLQRIQITIGPDGAPGNRQLHLVERATMVPIRSHTASGFRVKHIDFGPTRISGFMSADPASPFLPIAATPAVPAFDFDLAGILLVAFDLQPGDTVRFPSHSLEPTGMLNGRPTGLKVVTDTVTAVAHSAEDVDAGRLGTRRAIPVVVRMGRRTLTFWLGRETPYVLRLTAETPMGTTRWELP